jgi:thiosulfate/3-mercaptopyruvate sulfurtransferase
VLTTLIMAAALSYARPEQLVEAAWVAAHTRDANVRIVDLRRTGFESGHIPEAVWLDPESIRDASTAPSYMLGPDGFARAMGALGISNRTRVILYDDRGGLYAARLWWMLHAYGHTNVSLLNGGWTAWQAEGRPTETTATAVPQATFTAALQPGWLATAADIRASINAPGAALLDARTIAEMNGTDTRLSSRGGVIPGSKSLYWEDLLDSSTKRFKSADELQALFDRVGLHKTDAIVAYCWVGHRSAMDLFALRLMGYNRVQNYLGSWEEWSQRQDLPTAPYP